MGEGVSESFLRAKSALRSPFRSMFHLYKSWVLLVLNKFNVIIVFRRDGHILF